MTSTAVTKKLRYFYYFQLNRSSWSQKKSGFLWLSTTVYVISSTILHIIWSRLSMWPSSAESSLTSAVACNSWLSTKSLESRLRSSGIAPTADSISCNRKQKMQSLSNFIKSFIKKVYNFWEVMLAKQALNYNHLEQWKDTITLVSKTKYMFIIFKVSIFHSTNPQKCFLMHSLNIDLTGTG